MYVENSLSKTNLPLVSYKIIRPMLQEKTVLLSSCYGVVDGHHDYEVSIDILASGRTPLREMVTHRVSLEDIQEGFDLAYDKSSGSLKVHVEV